MAKDRQGTIGMWNAKTRSKRSLIFQIGISEEDSVERASLSTYFLEISFNFFCTSFQDLNLVELGEQLKITNKHLEMKIDSQNYVIDIRKIRNLYNMVELTET